MQSFFVKFYSRLFFIIGLHQYMYYGTSMGTIFNSYETHFIALFLGIQTCCGVVAGSE